MHDHELLADLVQHTDRRGAPADDRATTALRRHRPAENQLRRTVGAGRVHLAAGIPHALGDGAVGSHLPVTLDHGRALALSQNRAVGSLAEQEPERCDDHGLSRTRLAGERGEAWSEREPRLADHAEITDGDLFDHVDATSPSGPRQPATGSANLCTSRSVKGPGCSRASRTGTDERRTITRAPAARSWVLRPSHQSTPVPWVRSRTSTAKTESGPTTSGRAKRAWALRGTRSIASRLGQTTGPPAENEYAVDPVGVDITTPSQPKDDSGRPSTSMTTSSIRSRLAFSTVASLSAQVS